MTDNEVEFIKELTKLTKKYKVVISGCGCCGSPDVTEDVKGNYDFPEESGYVYHDHLEYACPTQFGWDHENYNYKDKVIK